MFLSKIQVLECALYEIIDPKYPLIVSGRCNFLPLLDI